MWHHLFTAQAPNKTDIKLTNGQKVDTVISWWRHQMEIFSALLAICVGNSPVTSEFPAQRTVTRSFDIFFDLHLNKRLSKQSWGWWFETLSRPLWRHCNADRWMSLTWYGNHNKSRFPTKFDEWWDLCSCRWHLQRCHDIALLKKCAATSSNRFHI